MVPVIHKSRNKTVYKLQNDQIMEVTEIKLCNQESKYLTLNIKFSIDLLKRLWTTELNWLNQTKLLKNYPFPGEQWESCVGFECSLLLVRRDSVVPEKFSFILLIYSQRNLKKTQFFKCPGKAWIINIKTF